MKKAARKIVCHHFNEVCEILYYFSASNIFDSSPNKYRSFFAALSKSETFVIVTALQNNKCLLYITLFKHKIFCSIFDLKSRFVIYTRTVLPTTEVQPSQR